jgi:hypothetical protein
VHEISCNFSYLFAVDLDPGTPSYFVFCFILAACNFSTEEAQAMELPAIGGWRKKMEQVEIL